MTDTNFDPTPDEFFMRAALREAEAALEHDDVPVGCVIVRAGRIIARGHNQRELLKDPTAHAEMVAITSAASAVESWRLEGCTLYVTLEPCAMCAGAMVLARLPRLVYGARDPKAGACGSVLNILAEPKLNHHPDVTAGVLAAPCGGLLSEFFRQKRAAGEK